MSVLTGSTLLAASFLVAVVILALFQTWVRLNAHPSSAGANFKRCAWVAFVCGVWWPFATWGVWEDPFPMWTTLADQRAFMLGFGVPIWIAGFSSVVQPWAYSIRPWLLGANLLGAGLFLGLFLGTVAWPGNYISYSWLFWSAVGFSIGISSILKSRPGQGWSRWPSGSADASNSQRTGVSD